MGFYDSIEDMSSDGLFRLFSKQPMDQFQTVVAAPFVGFYSLSHSFFLT